MKLNKSHECLNCHEQIGDSNYCPNCGQLNTDKKLTVRQMMNDFLGDYITFDSKFFRSLIPLLIKPGFLTIQYLRGKRAAYIFPFRLYLFTTFIFFFVIAVNTKIDSDFFSDLPGNAKSDSTNASFHEENEMSKDSLKSLIDQYSLFISDEQKKEFYEKIDSTPDDTTFTVNNRGFKISFGKEESRNSFIRYLQKKAEYIESREDGANIFWKETINQLPKVLFILLPVFAFILKLLYWRRKIYYVEHLIFSLHFHTYVFINLLIAIFFPYWYVIVFILLSVFVNLYMSLRGVYEQSRIKTFFKMGLLLFSYLFVLLPGFVILVLLAIVSV